MNKTASMLSKMADKLLKSADRSDAYAQSQAKTKRMKALHEAMTERYKYYITSKEKASYVEQVESDVSQLKKFEKKLTLTESDSMMLDRLYAKYRV